MSAHQEQYPIATMCRVLEVSTSGYYAWRRRTPSARCRSDATLTAQIRALHAWSRGTYGVPRMVEELDRRGHHVNPKRVARLMRAAGLEGVSRRQRARTTRRDRAARVAPDLVARDFTAQGPDQLWVADVTYVPTWVGFLYLAVVLDAWSRRIVGWAMAAHLRAELVVQALDMALWRRRPQDVIHHSDQGCQYTSIAFGRRCREAGVRPSMGSVGDCYDNALCESFFATLECELIDRGCFRTHAEARLEVFDYIEGWYNPHRRHSAINYDSPVDFERHQTGGWATRPLDDETSPGYAYQYAIETLLGTGAIRQLALVEQAFDHREVLRKFVRERDAADPDSPHVLFLGDYLSGRAIDAREVPRFVQRNLSFSEALAAGRTPVLLLLLEALAALGLALWATNRMCAAE